MVLSPSNLFVAVLAAAVSSSVVVAQGFEIDNDPVYCLADTPAISWPSSSLPNIDHVDLEAILTVTPVSATRTLLALRTPEPYARATLRVDWPGAFPNLASFVEEDDCGFQAAGISNRQGRTLIGMLETMEPIPFGTEPLELDITVVLSREQDIFGETAIVYAYEHIVVEPWMWQSAQATIDTEAGWAVSLLPTGALEMDLVSRTGGMVMAQQGGGGAVGGLQAGERSPFPALANSWGAAAASSSSFAAPEAPPPVEEETYADATGGQWSLAGSTWLSAPATETAPTTAANVRGNGWTFVTTQEGLASAAVGSSVATRNLVLLVSLLVAALATTH